MSAYTDFMVNQNMAIEWPKKRVGRAWFGSFGLALDGLVDAMQAASEARFAKLAPFDALPLIAKMRGMIRSPTETEEQFRYELQRAFYWHSLRGTDKGLIAHMLRANLTCSVFHNEAMTSIVGHDDPTLWARRWIIIQKPNDFERPRKWGDGLKWGDGSKWSASNVSQEMLFFIRETVRLFRCACWSVQGIFIVVDDNGLSALDPGWSGDLHEGGRLIVRIEP